MSYIAPAVKARIDEIRAGHVIAVDAPYDHLMPYLYGAVNTLTVGAIVEAVAEDGTVSAYRVTTVNPAGPTEWDGVTYQTAKTEAVNAAPARPKCPHGAHETDNHGVCYSCGTYVASDDVGNLLG